MFGKMFGGKKDKKDKKSKKEKKQKAQKGGHQRMTTEEQINYALKVSLQEQQAQQTTVGSVTAERQQSGSVSSNAENEFNDELALASHSSHTHQRMSTTEQINLAVQMSLQEQQNTGAPPETVNNEKSTETKGKTPAGSKTQEKERGHKRMSTQQAIEVAIQRSLQEMKDKPVADWTTEDLATWLSGLGADFEGYAEEVRSNELDGANFLPLELEDYIDIGVRNRYHRQRIWEEFQKVLTEQRSKQSKSAKQDRNASFSGVASLFSSPDDEPGTNENSSLDLQSAINKLNAAQQKIENLEKALEGERRRAERAEERLTEERETRSHLETELETLKTELEKKEAAVIPKPKLKKKEKEAPKPEEDVNTDVALGFVSFTQENEEETAIHKRDPSFTGAVGLFDDLNFDTDEEDEIVMNVNSDPTANEPQTVAQKKAGLKAAGRDRHKRDPSFSGELADLFSMDDMADMGFGPDAVKTDTVQFTQDDLGFTAAAPASANKHKRDPSYSGVRDLFEDDESEEQEEEEENFSGRPVPKQPRKNYHRKDVSFGGVQQLFEDEEAGPALTMKIAAETEEEELRNRIAEYEERLRDYESLREQYEQTQDTIETLQQDLSFQKNHVETSRERELKLEKELTKTREEARRARDELSLRIQQISKGDDSAHQVMRDALIQARDEINTHENQLNTLTTQVEQRDNEMQELRNSLNRERSTKQRLDDEKQNLETSRQKIQNELDEWKNMNSKNAGNVQEELVSSRLKSQDLGGRVDELEKTNAKLKEQVNEIQKSKIDLAIRTCAEIDRMRNFFRDYSPAPSDQHRAITVG